MSLLMQKTELRNRDSEHLEVGSIEVDVDILQPRSCDDIGPLESVDLDLIANNGDAFDSHGGNVSLRRVA